MPKKLPRKILLCILSALSGSQNFCKNEIVYSGGEKEFNVDIVVHV